MFSVRFMVALTALFTLSSSFQAQAAGPITSGSTVSGSVSGPTFLESWTFSGTAGQRIVISAVTTSGAMNTSIVLKAPGGGTETSTTADRLDWQLAATGTYTIEIQDQGLNDPGSYALGFLNITVGPLTSPGDLNGGPIVSADVKTGTMSGAADIDAFSFSGTNGNRVLMNAVATSGAGFNTVIYLYPPGGGSFATWSGGGDRLDFQLNATGTWTILIEDTGNDTAGGYSMSLLNVTAGPLSNGSDTDGGAIASNEIKTGQFHQGVDFDAFTFTGSTGNRVVMVGVSTGGAHVTQLSLYPPGGGAAIVSSNADRLEAQLTANGTWTIVIEESSNDETGAYTISFLNVTAGPLTSPGDLNGGPIVSADVKTGTMSGIGDIDGFTFTGTSGNRVLMNAVATSGAGFNTVIYLYPPGGGTFATWSGGGDRLDFQLNATGTWTILIEDTGNDTAGGYSMSLLNVTAGPLSNGSDPDGGAIASNEIKTGQFHQGVDFDAFTFTGSTGNRVVMVGVSTGAGTHVTQLSLYPPGGGAAIVSSNADRLEAQLTANGTWTIVIEESSNDETGAYTISFLNVTAGPLTSPGDLNGGPIVSADVKTGTMSGIGDIDGFTFTGTNGNRVLMNAVATSGAGFNTVIYLYPPGGGSFATWSGGGDRLDFQLNATGTWTILIEDTGNDTAGGYSMSLLNVTAGPLSNGSDPDGGAIASNEIKTGQFHQGVDFDAFTFTGSTGNRVVMVGVSTGAGTHVTQLSLYPPGGGAAIVSSNADRLEAQLTANGTWTIVIEESSNDETGAYTISFLNVTAGPLTSPGDLNGGPIVSADVKTGTMSGIGDIDGFTFTGTSGNRVLMNAVATSGAGFNTVIYLYPPGGGTFATWSGGGDRLDFQLNATGTWTILIEDTGNDTAGGYSMSLLNVTAGPLSNGSDPDGGAIASNEIKTGQFHQGVDFDAFTFTGSTGNRVVMVGIATGGAHVTQLSLYPPGGGAAIASSNADRLEAQLTANGTWTIVIEESSNDETGAYTISFLNITAGPLTNPGDLNGGPIVSNEIKTGTMSGIGDIDGYTFTGTSGNRVLIGGVATAGAGFNTVIYLYPPGGGTFATWSGGGDRLDFQLNATGTWTILIEDTGNDTAGSYTASFLNVTAGPYTGGAETDGGPIVSGVPRNGTALSAADFDGYTFTAASGDSVHISAIVTSGPMNTQITLFPPGGGAALASTTADVVAQELTLPGTYTIVIEDSGIDQTGNYTVTLNQIGGGGTDAPVFLGGTDGPLTTRLLPPSPSPFLESTRLDFSVVAEGSVQLRVFDVTGAQVRSLVDQTLGPGRYPTVWDGRDDHGARVASGVYYVQLVTGREAKLQKVVRLR